MRGYGLPPKQLRNLTSWAIIICIQEADTTLCCPEMEQQISSTIYETTTGSTPKLVPSLCQWWFTPQRWYDTTIVLLMLHSSATV